MPWPVEFVLRLHPKHIFQSKRLPPMSELSRAISQWENNLRWRLFHSESEGDGQDRSVWWKLRSRRSTPPCPHKLADEWEVFIYELKRGVFTTAYGKRSSLKFSQSCTSNLSRVAKWGIQMLREGPVGAVRTDKDGGYALVWKQSLAKAVLDSLSLPVYGKRLVHEAMFEEIAQDYTGIVKYIGHQTEDADLENSLLSSLRSGCKSFVTKILTTVKTHKPKGEQKIRLVHAAPDDFMKPGMKWIASLLKTHLAQYTHILKDTDHLLDVLCHVQVPPEAWLFRFDVKEFFMSGTHSAICTATEEAFPAKFRESARLLVEHILKSQIVTDGFHDSLYDVRIGSGMGLTCSGELSDCAFCHLAGSNFAADHTTQSQFGIIFYARFKDDGLIITTGSRDQRRSFESLFREKAKPFAIHFDDVSQHSISMLYVVLFKGPRWKKTGVLDYRLHTKPTNQWAPLLCSSSHHPSVHTSWPKGQLRRIKMRCSDPATVNAEVQRFRDRYRHHTGFEVREDECGPQLKRGDGHKHLPRLVLPYRQAWSESRIPHICNRIWKKCQMDLHTGQPADLQICWRLPDKHLTHKVRESNYVIKAYEETQMEEQGDGRRVTPSLFLSG